MTETTTTTIPALLPCPFCGASDPLVTDLPPHKHAIAALPDHPGSVTVECPSCDIGLIAPTRAEATAAWNRRAAPSAAQGLDEILKAARTLPSLKGITLTSQDPMAQARWLTALGDLQKAVAAYDAAPGAQPAQDDDLADLVLVPRDLIGAACAAIDKKRDAPKALAELRRYTTGDLSAQPAQGGSVSEIERLILAEKERVLSEGMASSSGEIWTVNGGKAAGLQSALDIVRALSAARASAPEVVTDPLDTPLPCAVSLPGMKFGKGVKLRTLVDAASRWKVIAAKVPLKDMEPALEEARESGFLTDMPPAALRSAGEAANG